MGINYIDFSICPDWLLITRPMTQKEKLFADNKHRLSIKDLHFEVEGSVIYFKKIVNFLEFIFPNKTQAEMKKERLVNKYFCKILRGQLLFHGCILLKYDLEDREELESLQMSLF